LKERLQDHDLELAWVVAGGVVIWFKGPDCCVTRRCCDGDWSPPDTYTCSAPHSLNDGKARSWSGGFIHIMTRKGLRQQQTRILSPTCIWVLLQQLSECLPALIRFRLLIHRVCHPVHRGVCVLVVWVRGDELVELLLRFSPLLIGNQIAATAKDNVRCIGFSLLRKLI
jgi:hypothetical protein